ncbi:MAG: DUF4416 family protein [Candidatus Theseobacter exili]|nr:DUF4416 family protein [Candidatus Theseobacter exili]
MGKILVDEKVKFITGLLFSESIDHQEVIDKLVSVYGVIDLFSPEMPFGFTSYYDKEMGPNLTRAYISFESNIDPGKLTGIKIQTNEIEEFFANNGSRQVNIDPGYLDRLKVVLATTKDVPHRVSIGSGIHAESALYFLKGSYKAWEWTYPDYSCSLALDFFNKVRGKYLNDKRKNRNNYN